jgi:hypothetical protein
MIYSPVRMLPSSIAEVNDEMPRLKAMAGQRCCRMAALGRLRFFRQAGGVSPLWLGAKSPERAEEPGGISHPARLVTWIDLSSWAMRDINLGPCINLNRLSCDGRASPSDTTAIRELTISAWRFLFGFKWTLNWLRLIAECFQS